MNNEYSRRSFLATAAIGGAPALLSAQAPSDTMRVAVIGVGNRGSFLLRHVMNVP
jgi:TAT (twin-arginine translocation) pathway signal sequence